MTSASPSQYSSLTAIGTEAEDALRAHCESLGYRVESGSDVGSGYDFLITSPSGERHLVDAKSCLASQYQMMIFIEVTQSRYTGEANHMAEPFRTDIDGYWLAYYDRLTSIFYWVDWQALRPLVHTYQIIDGGLDAQGFRFPCAQAAKTTQTRRTKWKQLLG